MQRAGSGSSIDSTTAALFAEARARFLADRAAQAESSMRAASHGSPGGASTASTPRQSAGGRELNTNPQPGGVEARERSADVPHVPSPFEMGEGAWSGSGSAVKQSEPASSAGVNQARQISGPESAGVRWDERLASLAYEQWCRLPDLLPASVQRQGCVPARSWAMWQQ